MHHSQCQLLSKMEKHSVFHQQLANKQTSSNQTIIKFKSQPMNHPNEICAICSKQPEDMLILTCSHNLCLDCATELYSASTSDNILQCQICFSDTPLDQQTVECLRSLAVVSCAQTQRQTDPMLPKPPKQQKILQCHEHREKSLYYCFDCRNANICSQCILGPFHNGHKVVTIKKASKILSDRILQNSRQLQNIKLRIEQDSQKIKGQKQQLITQYEQKQQKLKNLFQDILRQVNRRFTELSTQLQKYSRRNIEILQGSLVSLNQKYELIDIALRQNKQVTQKQETEQILIKFSQMEDNFKMYSYELPLNSHNQNNLMLVEQSCQSQIEQVIQKINWHQPNTMPNQKQNRMEIINSIKMDPSYLLNSRQKIMIQHQLDDSQITEKQVNNSVSKYSGIKPNSRRLELSRSMDNATNIINKLQERLKR